jgi:adenine C2-methylase RlmN of 23S rRNA A2503 and tRNA A37
VPDLPKTAAALLDRDFVRFTSTVEQAQTSGDGSTTKLLVRLQDGMQVEAVVMTYGKEGQPSYSIDSIGSGNLCEWTR